MPMQPLGLNRVLGDPGRRPEMRPHRVALCNWPAMVKDPRVETLDRLLAHVVHSGYDGMEFAPENFARYFPGESHAVVARKSAAACAKRDLPIFGATNLIPDPELRALNFPENRGDLVKWIGDSGGEFASFQIFLHESHVRTGGAYRDDARYLKWLADRVTELRQLTWDAGLNFYLEIHVDRITEDPAALCRIMEMAACELNADLSHYLCRGITGGPHLDKLMPLVGHAHVRMARMFGDLSAVVEDPKADWEAGGVTWQMFKLMKPALAGGLSSRTLSGETGPMHLVTDTLTQDAALIPLYRAMARYADASAQGVSFKVDSPSDLAPWG